MVLPGSYQEEESPIPQAYKILFETDGGTLRKITETPTRMILPMVRLSIVSAACEPNRRQSLIDVFMDAFDTRMISRDRKGRIEAVELMKGSRRDEDEEEIPL